MYEEKNKINIPRKVSTIDTLILNDCYGVPDKLKFGLTEGWDLTKYYLILVDTEEGFYTLKTALEDFFINFHLNTIDTNENSGVGINDELFSGKLTKDDIQYIPELKKVSSSKNLAMFKFHKQTIVISTNPKEIYTKYDGNKNLTIDDIGFFSIREKNTDFAAQLKDYKNFLKFAEEKKLEGIELLDWLYLQIIDGRFLYKPEITITQETQKKLTKSVQEEKREKLAELTNIKDFMTKDIPSMENVVNNIHKKVFENTAIPIDINDSTIIEADYVVESKEISESEEIDIQ